MRFAHPMFALALVAAACGEDAAGPSTSLTVRFTVARGDAELPCAALAEVSELTLLVFGADGVRTRAGFPKAVDCAAGVIELSGLPAGEHVVELTAKGLLAGDPRALLYRARATVSTPAASSLALSLKPEIAHLAVGWSFGSAALLPCTAEVREVEVLVSAGTSQATSYHRRVPCDAVPVTLDAPLPLLSFTVQVNAYSAQDFILYSATTVRALERGENEVELTLQPGGGQLYLDWSFALRGQVIRACDDPRVAVGELSAQVRSLEGGPAATDRFSCAVARPHVFLPQRFRPGRMLELELVAEGAARFVGRQRFTMPEGDRDQGPPLTLQAVGTATVAIAVETSTCAALAYEGMAVAVYPAEDPATAVYATTLPVGRLDAAVVDLPYGDYRVEVAELVGGARRCEVRQTRTINARWNTWAPLTL